ncbi:MAG: PHP-associated domain-containing protein [Thermodesulfobacteriota bacterium]
MGLVEIRADLHIHTSLSPCTDTWRMTPGAIVKVAMEMGLQVIAICDHNSMRNVAAVQGAAGRWGPAVLPGMEITSAEEVHVLGLFPDLERAAAMQEVVDRSLPGENSPDIFGYQVLMDQDDEILGSEDRFLAGATTMGIDEIVKAIHAYDGLAIASHVDREGFGILAQLGWIPQGLALDGLEVSWAMSRPEARERFPQIRNWPLLRSSDAHRPEEVGRAWSRLMVEGPTLEEIRFALRAEGGRLVIGGS